MNPRFWKRFFPVIHCKNWETTKENIEIALAGKVDGVFLINHQIPHVMLTCFTERALEEFPTIKIGVNYLDLDPISALSVVPSGTHYLWTDNPKIPQLGVLTDSYPEMFLDYRSAKKSNIVYYGSVAFKYQAPVHNLEQATERANKYVDIITTSGSATGEAAPIEKIKTMRQVIGDNKLLALASGVSSDNVSEYLPYVDDFLVASSISKDYHHLDEAKVKKLADIIANFNYSEKIRL